MYIIHIKSETLEPVCLFGLYHISDHKNTFVIIIPNKPFLNNPKDLDPSCKMDLDLWDCFGRKKICLITEEIR